MKNLFIIILCSLALNSFAQNDFKGVNTFRDTVKVYKSLVSGSSSDSVVVKTAGANGFLALVPQSSLGAGITLAASTYTPTLTNTQNVTSSSAYSCQYMRVGDVVTVSGRVDITTTTNATQTYLKISLPVSSALTASNELAGSVASDNDGVAGVVYGDATNDVATVAIIPVTAASRNYYFTFTYRILAP